MKVSMFRAGDVLERKEREVVEGMVRAARLETA